MLHAVMRAPMRQSPGAVCAPQSARGLLQARAPDAAQHYLAMRCRAGAHFPNLSVSLSGSRLCEATGTLQRVRDTRRLTLPVCSETPTARRGARPARSLKERRGAAGSASLDRARAASRGRCPRSKAASASRAVLRSKASSSARAHRALRRRPARPPQPGGA